jgi:site-specific DNA recombinase
MKGRSLGGPMRPLGWRKDRKRVNKREAALIRATVPRILTGVSCVTLAREWNAKGIPTVTGPSSRKQDDHRNKG